MPHRQYTDEELRRIKREVSCEALIRSSRVSLSRHGKDLIGLCPLHDDKNPSLVVTPSKNLWHCLGACQRGGGPIDWLMASQGMSFRQAAEQLREQLSGTEGEEFLPTTDHELMAAVTRYYAHRLTLVPDAQAFLKRRGLDDAELIEHFQIGYADRTLCYRLPSRSSARGKAMKGQLQRLGVFRSSGHELLTGCLTIPVFDEHDHVSEMYGRRIASPSQLRKGAPQHLYLPGPHRGVFNGEALSRAKPERVVVTEALLDALSFWRAGHRNVTSAYGTQGVTDELFSLLLESKEVLIAFDADEAGDGAALKLARRLAERGVASLRVMFPAGTDANAHLVEHGAEPLSALLDKALPMLEPASSPGTASSTTASTTKAEAQPPLAANEDAPTDDDAGQADDEAPAAEPKPSPSSSPKKLHGATVEVKQAASGGLGEEVHITLSSPSPARSYRVRGLEKNRSFDVLRVNLLGRVTKGSAQQGTQTERFFVDSLDLYRSKDRQSFIRGARDELHVEGDVLKQDLGKVLLVLEELQHRRLSGAMKCDAKRELSEKERSEAMVLLTTKDLAGRIKDDIAALGLVGEETGKLVAYLAATSRKLAKPLAVLIQSSSSAGKSSLMDAVLSLMPEEDVSQYSALTPQALYYMAEEGLSHKVLAISEEEGAERAAYPLKLLQSEGKLSIASAQKDESTGRLITERVTVKGPVMLFFTTTSAAIDEELENRCLVLSVSEERSQTEAIHASQRRGRTLEGLSRRVLKERVKTLHQNAQRLLEPLSVVNPYAEQLTFSAHKTRTRRDHDKFLTLIDAIALLHQHQRPIKTLKVGGEEVRYVEVARSDIELASELFGNIYGRSLDDLAPQTRRVLELVERMVAGLAEEQAVEASEVRFSRRQLREQTGLGDTQLKVHLARLVEHEHLVVHVQRPGRRFVYELVDDVAQYDGDGRPFDGHGRGTVGPRSGHGRDGDAERNGSAHKALAAVVAERSALSAEGKFPANERAVQPYVAANKSVAKKSNGALPASEAH